MFVPWNEVVVLDPIKLSKASTSGVLVPDILAERKPCPQHNSQKMKPLVFATWKHGFQVGSTFSMQMQQKQSLLKQDAMSLQGKKPDRSSILVESQALQESLDLGHDLHLVYHSARTKGYLSVLQLQLTPTDPSDIPVSLVKVHIKITIEGIVHEQVFEADPDIRYTYAWDRLNEYRQVS